MEDIKLLKFTIRGLNDRYSALKKINILIGESKNSKDFLDKVLGIIMDILEVEAAVVLVKGDYDSVRVEVFRAEIPFEKEEKIKKEIEEIEIPVKKTSIADILCGEKDFDIDYNGKVELSYRMLVQDAIGKINNIVTAAVKVNKKTVAVIELYNTLYEFSKDKKDMFLSVAGHVGRVLELFARLTVLQERTRSLKSLTSITEAISSPYQLDAVLDITMKNALSFFNADGCSILLKDSEGQLEFITVSGNKADLIKGKKIKDNEGIVGSVTQSGEPLLIKKVEDDKRFSPRVDSMTKMVSGSIICTPLKVADEVIGSVEIVRSREKVSFNEEELALLMILASHAGIAIEKARLYSQKDKWLKSTVELLSRTIDAKDKFFPEHTKMVKKYIKLLSGKLNLNPEETEYLAIAATVQDIGKLVIDEKILGKADKLSDEEWSEVRKHPEKSIKILSSIQEFSEIIPIIKYHHERYDGTGYPEKLSGREIPKMARILAVVDSYSALIGRRPYREALSQEKAIEILINEKGKQFDPEIVDAFIKCIKLP